ncbi:M14 family metallopeptidase [Nocardia sp. NPDC051990]|uniref:M14 family metallopeptidase n=1 Tax=Nocardia sp. NPDC051990 TaxID=3155285 RepID=UPI00343B6312
MSYLNIEEVESALVGLSTAYPEITELIELPYRTYEGRVTHALRIGPDSVHDGVLFTACAHAREWGGAEICVYLAADLLEAYTTRTGLTYGGTSFSPTTVRMIVANLSVFVLPCVNPDGRKYDQENDALWRKNRNPADSGGNPKRIGVDLNRNQRWLWDFRRAFAPAALNSGTLASDDPGNDLYHGSAPGSEPEGHNIRWMLDTYRFIGHYIDIHSYTGDLLYPWGDDRDQSDDPGMNFTNPAYDGQRGVGVYGEYIPQADLTEFQGLAARVVGAMNGVRGQQYVAKQSAYLWGGSGNSVSYPTSGAVDDYAYGRHFVSRVDRKVLAFTLEFGFIQDDARLSFHPLWPQMQQIVTDVDAGLVEFCAAVARRIPPWIIAWRRLFPWEIYGPLAKIVAPLVEGVVGIVVSGVRSARG